MGFEQSREANVLRVGDTVFLNESPRFPDRNFYRYEWRIYKFSGKTPRGETYYEGQYAIYIRCNEHRDPIVVHRDEITPSEHVHHLFNRGDIVALWVPREYDFGPVNRWVVVEPNIYEHDMIVRNVASGLVQCHGRGKYVKLDYTLHRTPFREELPPPQLASTAMIRRVSLRIDEPRPVRQAPRDLGIDLYQAPIDLGREL
jgi:hypothetical protein